MCVEQSQIVAEAWLALTLTVIQTFAWNVFITTTTTTTTTTTNTDTATIATTTVRDYVFTYV